MAATEWLILCCSGTHSLHSTTTFSTTLRKIPRLVEEFHVLHVDSTGRGIFHVLLECGGKKILGINKKMKMSILAIHDAFWRNCGYGSHNSVLPRFSAKLLILFNNLFRAILKKIHTRKINSRTNRPFGQSTKMVSDIHDSFGLATNP